MHRFLDTALALQRSGAFEVLLPLILKATLIALIGRLLIAALPRASAATRYLVAVTSLAAVLLLPLMTFALPAWRVAILPPDPTVIPSEVEGPGGAISVAPAPTLTQELAGAPRVVRAAAIVADSGARAASFLAMLRDNWRGWLLLAVIAVGILFFVRIVIGVAGIWWVTRRGREVEDEGLLTELDRACDRLGVTQLVRVLVSDRVDVPLVWGLHKPILILPAHAMEWTRERLRVVFLHELAHLRRRDAVTLVVTRASAALWWFHPVVWSLDRAARRDCEQACDDLVLHTGTLPSDYADHLLSIAKLLPHRDPFGAVTLAMSRRSQLEGRLLSILQPHVRRASTTRTMALIAIALGVLLVIPIATLQLTAAPSPGKAPSSTVTVIEDRDARVHDEDADADRNEMASSNDEGEGKNDQEEHVVVPDWYQRGNQYLRKDEYEKAIAAYEKAIELGDEPGKAAYNAGCAYALQNDRDHAMEWLQKAVHLGFDNAEKYLSDSDLDPVRSDPRFRALIESMGGRQADRRVREAMEKYEDARSDSSAVWQDWSNAGVALLRVRQLPEAISALRRAVELNPANNVAWHNLACAYALDRDTRQALEALSKSVVEGNGPVERITRDPDLASLRTERGFIELVQLARDLELAGKKRDGFDDNDVESWKRSLPEYERVVHDHPNLGRAWFNLGFARLRAGQPRAAAEAYQRSLDLGHRPVASKYNLACSYAVAGDRDQAFRWLSEAMTMDAKTVAAYIQGDHDLESLWDDPRFDAIHESVLGFEKEKRHKNE